MKRFFARPSRYSRPVLADDVLNTLKEVLARDFKVDRGRVSADASFRGTLGLDSLDAVDLVYLLCKEYGLPQNLHPWRNLHTVQQVIDHVCTEVAKKADKPT